MSLPSLFFDVLLAVLRDLDVADIIRIGMTCKALHRATQEHHVWVDQLEKLRREDPVLKPATPPLASLSTRELKTLVTGRARLRLRMENGHDNLGFAAKGLITIPARCDLILLPGGKHLLVIQYNGAIALRRIELKDGQVSLPVVTDIKSKGKLDLRTCGWSKLLTTMSPCPILVLGFHTESTDIFRINHHSGVMNLETTFHFPGRYHLLRADGQGRVVGFLVRRLSEPPRAMVIHLDHPGLVMELDIPPTYAPRAGRESYLWNICIPIEGLVVTYSPGSILACKIPNFSSLPPGIHLKNVAPMWSWPGLDLSVGMDFQTYMTSEVIYDPLSAREFDLYFIRRGWTTQMVTVTIPIDLSDDDKDDSSSKSDELPVLKQEPTLGQNSEPWDSATTLYQNGLYIGGDREVGGSSYLVAPLKGLASRGPRMLLRLFVSHEELPGVSQEVEIDEATGRVVIWEWDMKARETKMVVGDLV